MFLFRSSGQKVSKKEGMKDQVTYKNFDACHSASMLLTAPYMSDTATLSSKNRYFQDFQDQRPVNHPIHHPSQLVNNFNAKSSSSKLK